MKQLLTRWNSTNLNLPEKNENEELFINYQDFLTSLHGKSKGQEKNKADLKWNFVNVSKKKLQNVPTYNSLRNNDSSTNLRVLRKSTAESQFQKSPLKNKKMNISISKSPLSRQNSMRKSGGIGSRKIGNIGSPMLQPLKLQPKMLRIEKVSTIQQNDELSERRKKQLMTNEDNDQMANPISEATQKKDNFSYFYKQDKDNLQFKLSYFNEQQPLIGSLIEQYKENQNVLPKKLNIRSNIQQDLELKNYFIGKNHAPILGRLLSQKEFKSVNLTNSNISSSFISNLKNAPLQLNLSKNKVDFKSCSALGQIFRDRKQKLREINLEGNKIGNKAAIELVRHLNDNRSLKLLNLSDNLLDDQFATFFKIILISNDTIEELYLHWNQIKSLGAASILEGCTARDYVKVLDLSWNQIGTRRGIGNAHEKICKCLTRQKKSIVHFDLSFNGFNLRESELLQVALKNNKSLLGFHFEGNYGYIDRQGFLQLPSDFENFKIVTLQPTHRIQGAKPLATQAQQSNSKYIDHCWICDNWQEVSFSWPMLESFEQILLHLSIENYKPLEMDCNKNQDYEILRMCPLGRVWFYFTINKEQRLSNIYNVDVNGVTLMNYIDVQITKQIVDDDFYNLMEGEPRKEDKFFEYASEGNGTDSPIEEDEIEEDESSSNLNQIKPRYKWKISKSLFKDYIRDDEDLLDKAFEFDWTNSKISTIKGINVESTTLRQYYSQLKDLFRYVASQSIVSNVPVVTLSQFHDLTFFLKIKVAQLDIRYLEIRSDQTNTQTLTNSLIQQTNPVLYQQIQNTKGLNRRQFIELLVRVLSGSIEFEQFMERNVLPAMKGYESENWRLRRYWNSYCERVIRKHQHVLEHIYVKYCSSKIMPFTAYKCLYFEEFRQIWIDGGFANKITEREIGLCFILSQQTSVEEINSDRYLSMNFMEFLEGFARMAERLSLAPILMNKQVEDVSVIFQVNFEFLPLCFKLESLVVSLNGTLFGKQVDEKLLLDYIKYYESMEEQLIWRKVSKCSEKLSRKILAHQGESLIKSKLKKSFNLEIIFDDGLGIFKNIGSVNNLNEEEEEGSIGCSSDLSHLKDYDTSF